MHSTRSGGNIGRCRRSITGTVETLLISSVYSNIPFPGKELWCDDRSTYQLRPGQAFLIEKPGQYQYYRSPNADHWELRFISFNLACLKIWGDLTERFGRVFEISEESGVMRCWHQIYQTALNNEMEAFIQLPVLLISS